MKRIVCMLLVVCLFANISPALLVQGIEYNEVLSDHECALMSSITYCNTQDDILKVLDDKEFSSKRIGNNLISRCELKDFKNVDSVINLRNTNGSSFSVNTYKKGNNVVIAFRGSDEGVIKENLSYITINGHEQAKYAKKYIDNLPSKKFIDENTKIYITGHSLGGYLALYATGELLHSSKFAKQFVKCVTFNGLGISQSDSREIQKELMKLNNNQLINYRIHGDLVSKIGKHFTDFVSLDMLPKEKSMTENPHKMAHFLDQPLSRQMQTPDKNDDDKIVSKLIISAIDVCDALIEFLKT